MGKSLGGESDMGGKVLLPTMQISVIVIESYNKYNGTLGVLPFSRKWWPELHSN